MVYVKYNPFNLEEGSRTRTSLLEQNVCLDHFKDDIVPFLSSLEGRYKPKGGTITNFFGFPRTFCFSHIGLVADISDFIDGKKSDLELEVQDLKGLRLDRAKENLDEMTQPYRTQKGILHIRRECPYTKVVDLELGDVETRFNY